MNKWFIDRELELALFTGSFDRNSDDSDNYTDNSANDSNDGRVLLHVVKPCALVTARSRGIIGTLGYFLVVNRMSAGSRMLGIIEWW